MNIAEMTAFARWRYALKPNSWLKLLVPFFLGQSIGIFAAGETNAGGLIIGFLFTLFGLVYIVLLNDWADESVDRVKREMFPDGCSPKTIPDGILPANLLLLGGILAGAIAIGVASIGEFFLGRDYLLLYGIGAMLLFSAYSLPPVKLNYRGGGEALEMLGVGGILPIFNSYSQSALWYPPGAAEVLPAYLFFALASAIASGFSDEESDRYGGKITFVTRFGNAAGRKMVFLCLLVGALFLVWGSGSFSAIIFPVRLTAVAIIAWHGFKMYQINEKAVTNAFVTQNVYKYHLHLAIWLSMSLIAIYFVIFA